ncbi:uncharacterized protein V1516DRAFT_670022 [Lipomyces oligophaga]|uniref:uncharacterized protein n=1 Tax=Lipomyces oligophaga TaxID=45792 RepID=UPI0034CE6F27
MLGQRARIAVAEIIIYVVLLPVAVFCHFQHRKNVSAYWRIILFCAIRIASSALVIYIDQNSSSLGVEIAAIILLSIASSPLISAYVNFISPTKVLKPKGEKKGPRLELSIDRGFDLMLIAAIVLGSIGGSDTADGDADDLKTGLALSKASTLIMLVVLVLSSMHALYYILHVDTLSLAKRNHILRFMTAFPFILVRLIYSILSIFTMNSDGYFGSSADVSKWNSIEGSWQIYLVMGVLMEVITVIIYSAVGLYENMHDNTQNSDIDLHYLASHEQSAPKFEP